MLMTSKFSIKPGDLIEWAYRGSDELVSHDEMLWSTSLHRYVPIGSKFVHLLIAVDNDHIVWFNSEGLFHAGVDDMLCGEPPLPADLVVPHPRGTEDHTKLNMRSEC
jgi:hypothetical protein